MKKTFGLVLILVLSVAIAGFARPGVEEPQELTFAYMSGIADPFMFMNFWFDSDRWGLPGNRSFYKNDKVDGLIREAAVSSDIEKRIKLYNEAQEIIMKDAPYIFLYQVQTIVSLRKNVKGYVYNPMLESMYNFESISKQ